MGTRRKAREAALQFLFQDDFVLRKLQLSDDLEERFDDFCTLYQVNKKARPYILVLLRGTMECCAQIDKLIEKNAKNWRLKRIAATDRNLLRIAVYEMLYCDDVPAQVAINEALEIAKRFGSVESPAFINGVLDAVKNDIVRKPGKTD